jgi:hypothetical protein
MATTRLAHHASQPRIASSSSRDASPYWDLQIDSKSPVCNIVPMFIMCSDNIS